MALKGDIYPLSTNIDFFMNETAERGVFVVYSTAGSGAAMDDAAALATVTTSPSGKVVLGCLLNTMVNIDQTRQHINWHKDELQIGNKCDVLVRGFIRTDMLKTGDTPNAGDPAYYDAGGEFTTTAASDQVGVFAGPADAEGYVEVEVNVQ